MTTTPKTAIPKDQGPDSPTRPGSGKRANIGWIVLAAKPGAASPRDAGGYDVAGRVSALVSSSARLGVARLSAQTDYGSLPPRSRAEARASAATANDPRSTIEEYLQASASIKQAAALHDFADKPLIVLTAVRGNDAAWFAAQKDMATLSTNSVNRVIDGATHISLIIDQKTPPPPLKRSSTSSHRSGAHGRWSGDSKRPVM